MRPASALIPAAYSSLQVDPAENRFILSRRDVVEEAAASARAEVFGKLAVGDVVTGKVARITSFGAFIDLGGVDGLVHLTELSHERNISPKSAVTVGEEVEVKVLAIDEVEGRVSLSLKATQPGPWDGVEQKLAAGDVIEGKVKRIFVAPGDIVNTDQVMIEFE